MTSQFTDILNQVQKTKVCKMHILWCMASKFCVKFENVPFEISHKFFNTFSTKCAFMRYMKLPDIEFWHLKFYWDRSQGYLLTTMPLCKFVEELRCYLFNSSPLDKMAAILQTMFADAFLWVESFWFKFHWSLFLRANWQYPRRIYDKPVSEPMLTQSTDAYMRH